MRKMNLHWTEDIFKNHPELFLKGLEERYVKASSEVDTLLRYLNEQEFQTTNILDLNCGIGRHSIELGKRGFNVLGTDFSPRYIEIAKERAKNQGVEDRVRFKVVDMRRIASGLSYEKTFDGVINLYTSFGFYDEKTNADILRQCCSLVRSEGFFVLEIMNRDWLVKNFQKRGYTRVDDLIRLEDRDFDAETSRMHTTWTFLLQQDDTNFVLKKQVTIDHRIWSLHELVEMFGKTGWKFKAVYPGFSQVKDDVPLTTTNRFLFIAKK